jgi:hydrogenase expression/formation protein HypD
MKYVDEFRTGLDARKILASLAPVVREPMTLMEICGGQTHTLIKFGIDDLLPDGVSLVHGPGCPVCVTPLEMLDRAMAIASRPEVIFTSFGDMLRVPGSDVDLLTVKANGGDVRIVYSPLDALRIAEENPDREVVFFAVGFEPTAPPNGMAIWQAKERGVQNFSALVAHVLVPPAIEVILGSETNRVQAFLAAGHVCTVMGFWEYGPLAEKYRVPIIVTGFEPLDLLQGISMAVRALAEGRVGVENQYARSVRREGNVPAQELMKKVFQPTDRAWRGIGTIPMSGLELRPELEAFDAAKRFDVETITAEEPAECVAGDVLQGLRKPPECAAFGVRCTPDRPLGAPMVSAEGACSAYYRYRRS